MTCLLDTMIVSYFLNTDYEQSLASAAKVFPMAIVEEVRRELRDHPELGGHAFDRWLSTSNIDVRPILVGSPAAATLTQLLKLTASAQGLGERASIALAGSDSSLTFVTHDKGALSIAVRELWMAGERVLGLAPFLRRLFESSALTELDALDEIMSLACTGVAQWPTWWATWRAGVGVGH